MTGVRVLIAKTSLDGHWRGTSVVSRALRDAGFEVIYAGEMRAEEIVNASIDEDVQLVGLNIGGRVEVAVRIVEALKNAGLGDLPIMAGGTLAVSAIRSLEEHGVTCFPPGSSLKDIVDTAESLTCRAL